MTAQSPLELHEEHQKREGPLAPTARLVTSPGPVRDKEGNIVAWRAFSYMSEWQEGK